MENVGHEERSTGLLRDVLAAMAVGDSLDAVLQAVCGAVVERLDAAFARVWLLRPIDGRLVLVASAGLYTHLDGPHGTIRVGEFKIGLIAAERRPHLSNDVVNDPAISDPEWARREGMTSFAGYPLIIGNRLLGVFGLFSRTKMDHSVVDLLATVADAMAAGTDRLQAEERARAALRTLHELGRTMVAELDLERLVQIVTDSATRVTGAAFGAFFYNLMNEHGESVTRYTVSGAPVSGFERFPLPRNTAIVGPTFRGERIVRFDDVTQAPEFGHNHPYHGMPEGHLRVRSYLAVPVIARDGQVTGALFFGHPEPGRFSRSDEDIVEGIAGYAAVAIANAREFREEQEIAVTLQRALLPTIGPHDGTEVAVRYLPAVERAEVGGDWYDVTAVGGGRIAITVGDVEGHSVAAAARMGAVRHALAVHVVREIDPSVSLYELDKFLRVTGQPGFVTAVQALYDPHQSTLTVARAGHFPPLIVPPTGAAHYLHGDPAPPLGIGLIRAAPPSVTVHLSAGTAVVFFTDGLVERRHVHLDDTLEALRTLVSDKGGLSAEELCDEITEGLLGSAGASDDIAMLILKPTARTVLSTEPTGEP